MKRLKEYITDSLLSDYEDISSKIDITDEIKKFIKNHYYTKSYKIVIKKDSDKYIVNVSDDLNPKKPLGTPTNDLFEFGEVYGNVDFSDCDLITLKGSPRKVHGFFDCSYNDNLTSLEGSPEEVRGNFFTTDNPKIKSLKGLTKTILGSLYCKRCGKQFTVADVKKENVRIDDFISLYY